MMEWPQALTKFADVRGDVVLISPHRRFRRAMCAGGLFFIAAGAVIALLGGGFRWRVGGLAIAVAGLPIVAVAFRAAWESQRLAFALEQWTLTRTLGSSKVTTFSAANVIRAEVVTFSA